MLKILYIKKCYKFKEGVNYHSDTIEDLLDLMSK